MRKDRRLDRHDRDTVVDPAVHQLDTTAHNPGIVVPADTGWNTFTDQDTTPDISTGSYWKTGNTAVTTITNFDNPKTNIHKITVLFTDTNTTIENNANIAMQSGQDFTGAVDDVKVFLWDGLKWVEQAPDAALVGAIYFPHDSDVSDIAGYDSLLRKPSDHAETTHATSVSSSDGDVAIEEFITEAGDPGVPAVIAGIWEFHVHAMVSNAAGTTNLKLEVYKRTTGGAETLIFSTEQEINSTSPIELEWTYTQIADIAMNQTDRLVVKFLCNTTSVPSRTVTTYYEGTERTAHIHTPITVGVVSGVSAVKHMPFTIWNPNAVQSDDNEVCLLQSTPAALTISKLEVTLDASGNEVAGDLKWADAFIGLANATVINDFDTTSGVRSDDSITAGSVAAGKCLYLKFDSAPNADITQMHIFITFTFD